MRILVVSQYFWPENFRINDLVKGLISRGHEVTVLTGKPNYPEGSFYDGYGFFKKGKDSYSGADVFRVPLIARGKGSGLLLLLNYLSFAFFSCLLGPFLCRGKYDGIFVFEVSPITVGLPAIVLKKIKKAPIFFWVLDLWPESLTSSGKVKTKSVIYFTELLVRFIYKHSDMILSASKGFIPRIKKLAPLAAERNSIKYFPNFIEEAIDHHKKDVAEIKYSFPDGFRILFAGNIGFSQAFPTILDAVEKLKSYQDIHWIVLGDGRMFNWVRDQIAMRGLQSNIHLAGRYPLETMPYFFSNVDVLLVSLRKEPNFELTVPGKIQSYLVSGKPIIASLDGEGASLIEAANAGLACPAEDSNALAESVLKLYHMEKKELDILGANGRSFCLKHFNRDKLFDRLEDWFKEADVFKQQRVFLRN
jgi:glycosyltransferase involved in cell wall biosynthesis